MNHRMRVLYLGPASPLIPWLREMGLLHIGEPRQDVTHLERPITVEDAKGHDFLLSFGYRHILTPDVLDYFSPKFRLNVHLSYLPWNRGADPNFWSWVEDTPKGVTIHSMDTGLDTGPIMIRGYAGWSNIPHFTMTLRKSYTWLQNEGVRMVQWWWLRGMRDGKLDLFDQPSGGSFHTKKDRLPHEACFTDHGLDLPIAEMVARVHEAQAVLA